MSAPDLPLLDVRNLRTRFRTRQGELWAVNGVSFSVARGETLALVGESGSGKSVTAASLLRLLNPPGEVVGGEVWFDGRDLLRLTEREMQAVRGGRIALVPQDALAALNPVHSVGAQVVEALQLHHRGPDRFDRRAAWAQAVALLERVKISNAAERAHEPPHRLSGGQRQRVLIAMALAGGPDLLIADEPTTALDVTTQAHVIELLFELQQDLGLAILLITHDLGVVAQMASRVAVMYAGRLVEQASTEQLLIDPAHPYTAGLLASVALQGLRPGAYLPEIPGQVPPLNALPPGCAFSARCDHASVRCRREQPPIVTHVSDAHDSGETDEDVDEGTDEAADLTAHPAPRHHACWHPLSGPSPHEPQRADTAAVE